MIESLSLLALVLGCYLIARRLFVWSGRHVLALPLIGGVALLLAATAVLRLDPQALLTRTSGLRYLMDLSVVAMAIPLHAAGRALLQRPWPWLSGLLAAGVGSMACVVVFARLLSVDPVPLASLLPKAATMPVALGVTGLTGGNANLTTLSVVATGLTGALWIPFVLRRCRIEQGHIHAFALGANAHAIGLVRVQAHYPQWQHCAIAGMCGNALVTAILARLWL